MRSVRKTIRFKGKQYYAVFNNYPHNVGRLGYATSKRISGNFSTKAKAKAFLKKIQKK